MPAPTPRAAVEQAFAALATADVEALVALVHPDAARQFQATQAQFARLAGTMPFDFDEPMTSTFVEAVFGVRTPEALVALDPAELLRRWFANRLRLGPDGITRTVIGEVAEGADMVHVVFREVRPSLPMAPVMGTGVLDVPAVVRVATARRHGAGWAVELNGGIGHDEDGSFGASWDA